MGLRPDIAIKMNSGSEPEFIGVIDTRWKYRYDSLGYQSEIGYASTQGKYLYDISIGDVRQMYAYARYLGSSHWTDWMTVKESNEYSGNTRNIDT